MSGNIESVSSSWLDAIKDLFLGISSDDYIYATALIFCVAFGFMYKKIKERSKKEIIGSVVGIMLVMATCRLQAIIPFGFVIGNICLQKYFHSTISHWLSFAFSFGGLSSYRIVTIYGFGLAYSPFTNIILMFLCLRMVSLAFEIHDNITLKTGQILHCSSALKVEVKSEESVGEDSEHSRAPLQAPLADTSENNKNSSRYADLTKDDKGRATIRKKVDGVREIPPMEERSQTKEKSKHSKPPLEHIPNSLEIWHYAFNYIGILTGPFVRYNTYCDMLNLPFSQEAKVRGPLFKCLSSLPLTVLLYILFSRWYPLEVMVTSDFYNSTSFWHRLGYCIFIFIKFRMRFYAAFALSESVCITAGLGAYPVELNPKPGKGISDRTEAYRLASMGKPLFYNFETVRNVDLAATEFGSVKEAMRAWNLSVQYWLASCVYSRFKGPRSIRAAVTLGVSALWHGIQPAYFLSMCGAPLMFIYEDIFEKLLTRWGASQLAWTGFRVILGAGKQLWFSYNSIGFLLLKLPLVFQFWSSVYFCVPVTNILAICIGNVLLHLTQKTVTREKSE